MVDIISRFEGEVRRFFSTHREPTGLVVAVSGGPDSVALLRAFLAVFPDRSWPIVVGHLNHQLRGTESDGDEAFVRSLVQESPDSPALHYEVEHCDIATLAEQRGENLEAVAREERYSWLIEVAKRHGCDAIATGHTANDQAETLLHRLVRGTGLQGLRGIAPERSVDRDHPGIQVVRPLLRLSRSEVLAYLAALQQPARSDSSNADPKFLRNRIRHELLPYLETNYNAAMVSLLTRLAEQAEEMFREEQALAESLLAEVERPRAKTMLIFDATHLETKSRREIRNLFRHVWLREGWSVDAMSFAGWERLTDVVLSETSAVDLPGPVHVRRRQKVVQVEPRHRS